MISNYIVIHRPIMSNWASGSQATFCCRQWRPRFRGWWIYLWIYNATQLAKALLKHKIAINFTSTLSPKSVRRMNSQACRVNFRFKWRKYERIPWRKIFSWSKTKVIWIRNNWELRGEARDGRQEHFYEAELTALFNYKSKWLAHVMARPLYAYE